jgi:hypothetical protein
LDAVHQLLVLLAALLDQRQTFLCLGKKRYDRCARVTANDVDVHLGRIDAGDPGEKGRSTDDIEGRDAKQPMFPNPREQISPQSWFTQANREYDTDLVGSKTPAFLKTSATMGTVEFTGLAMTRILALGETSAAALAKSRTMEALVWHHEGFQEPR